MSDKVVFTIDENEYVSENEDFVQIQLKYDESKAVGKFHEQEEIIVLSSDDEEEEDKEAGKENVVNQTNKQKNEMSSQIESQSERIPVDVKSEVVEKTFGSFPKQEEIILLSSDDEEEEKETNNVVNQTKEMPLASIESQGENNLVDKNEVVVENVSDDIEPNNDTDTTAKRSLQKLLELVVPKLAIVKVGDRDELKNKFWSYYSKIHHLPSELLQEFARRIEKVIDKVKEDSSKEIWETLEIVKAQFNEDNLKEPFIFSVKEARRLRTIRKFEKSVKKVRDEIENLEQMTVEWDKEEEESSYVRSGRLQKLLKDKLDKVGDVEFAERPFQKKISFGNSTPYPHIERAVEDHLNKIGYLSTPSFRDILKIVAQANIRYKLNLNNSQMRKLGKDLLEQVIDHRQELRMKDIPIFCDDLLPDPSLTDPELKRKLDENAKNAKSLDDVVGEFSNKQQKPRDDEQSKADSLSDNELSGCESMPEDDDESEEDDNSLDEADFDQLLEASVAKDNGEDRTAQSNDAAPNEINEVVENLRDKIIDENANNNEELPLDSVGRNDQIESSDGVKISVSLSQTMHMSDIDSGSHSFVDQDEDSFEEFTGSPSPKRQKLCSVS